MRRHLEKIRDQGEKWKEKWENLIQEPIQQDKLIEQVVTLKIVLDNVITGATKAIAAETEYRLAMAYHEMQMKIQDISFQTKNVFTLNLSVTESLDIPYSPTAEVKNKKTQ